MSLPHVFDSLQYLPVDDNEKDEHCEVVSANDEAVRGNQHSHSVQVSGSRLQEQVEQSVLTELHSNMQWHKSLLDHSWL